MLHSFDDKEVTNNIKNRRMSLTEDEKEVFKEKMEAFSEDDFFRSLGLLYEEGVLADSLRFDDTYFADEPQNIEMLRDVVMRLTPIDRRIYSLVLIKRHTYSEAAEIIGMREDAVGYHVRKIRKIIKDKLKL